MVNSMHPLVTISIPTYNRVDVHISEYKISSNFDAAE